MLVLIGSEKGGAGKTTLAINIATMCAHEGKSTILVDTDAQESASMWGSLRSSSDLHPPVPVFIKRGKVGYDLLQLRDKFDVVVIDAGGRDSVELRQSITVADKMVVPVRPSQFDTWSLSRMLQLFKGVEEATNRLPSVSFLLNAVSPNPQVKEAEELRGVLSAPEVCQHYATVMTPQVTDRISFRRSINEGKGVIEQSGDLKAIAEMRSVYEELFR